MTTKRIIMLLSIICVLALVFSIPPMILANHDDDDQKCKLQGAWFTEITKGFQWMVSFNGKGDNNGTAEWDFPIPAYPPNSSWTAAKGIWTKSGPNTYNYKFQCYLVDNIDGTILQIGFQSGTIVLTDCNMAGLMFIAEFYYPGDDEPFYTFISPNPMPIKRLLMNQSSPIQ